MHQRDLAGGRVHIRTTFVVSLSECFIQRCRNCKTFHILHDWDHLDDDISHISISWTLECSRFELLMTELTCSLQCNQSQKLECNHKTSHFIYGSNQALRSLSTWAILSHSNPLNHESISHPQIESKSTRFTHESLNWKRDVYTRGIVWFNL